MEATDGDVSSSRTSGWSKSRMPSSNWCIERLQNAVETGQSTLRSSPRRTSEQTDRGDSSLINRRPSTSEPSPALTARLAPCMQHGLWNLFRCCQECRARYGECIGHGGYRPSASRPESFIAGESLSGCVSCRQDPAVRRRDSLTAYPSGGSQSRSGSNSSPIRQPKNRASLNASLIKGS